MIILRSTIINIQKSTFCTQNGSQYKQLYFIINGSLVVGEMQCLLRGTNSIFKYNSRYTRLLKVNFLFVILYRNMQNIIGDLKKERDIPGRWNA